MRCPACGTPHGPEARFCASCGVTLVSNCRSCESELSPGARFCSACGTSVGEATEERPGVERKIVSALFADLAGFTASSASADPEDVAARLQTFHAAVRTEIERFGGRVEKLIGDGVFAIFGAPVAHEDDPERAVRAALRLQETLAQVNETSGLALAVRVAVTTGEAMVRLGGTDVDHEGVVGDVVNTASRLQQLAPEGGVLVDQRTHAATHRVAEYEERGPVTVKGKSEPLYVWRAIRMRGRFGVGVEVDDTGVFVGREDSLRLLSDSFERAVRSGTAQLVTISGEPGVGKTRLVAEFRRVVDEAPDLVWWRQGHCLAYGDGISFWALAEIVKAHAGVLDGEPVDAVRLKILSTTEDLIADEREAAWVAARLLDLIGATTGGSSREERFSAWVQFFDALAGRNPLVMVVDDLHWADPALVEFLEILVETAEGVPLLLIVTARPELYDPHPGWGGGKRNSTTIALGPLSPEDTSQLVEMLTDTTDRDAVEEAVRRSGGNPLYATELIRMTADRQASGTDDDALPETIQAVIASRIDLLEPRDKRVLQAASVVGKVFWSGAVAHAIALPEAEVEDSLRLLARRELIRRARRSSMRDHDEYSFWHDLVADVAYGQIPRPTRRSTHEAIGRWLEEQAGERTGELSEILAHHYGTALILAQADGEVDAALAGTTRRHLVEAASRTQNVNVPKSLSLLQRALELSTSPAERAEVLIPLTRSRHDAEGGQESVETGRAALDEARLSGDLELTVRAAVELARAQWVAGDGDGAHATTRELLELAERLPEGPLLTKVLSNAIGTLYLQGDHSHIGELIDRTLAVGATYGPKVDHLNALKWAGTYRAEQGDRGAVNLLRSAYEGAAELGETYLQISTANNLASMLINAEGIDEAIAICEAAIALGPARGAMNAADFTRLTLSEALFHLGRFADVREQYEYLIDRYGAATYAGQGGLGKRASVAALTKHPSAPEWTAEYLAIARRVQDHQAYAPALASRICSLYQHGEVEEALHLVREFEKLTEDRLWFRGPYLSVIGRMLIAEGEIAWLERLVEPFDESRSDQGYDFFRGMLLRAQGEADEAIGHLDRAVSATVEWGSPWIRGDVLIERATVRIDLGDLDGARRDLDEASELLRVLGGSVFDDFLADQRIRLDRASMGG